MREVIEPHQANEARFIIDVLGNRNNAEILNRWDAMSLPDGWLVAGCLFQSVWNQLSGQLPESSIKDYDIFYHDPSDLSVEAEKDVQHKAERLFSDLPITVEVVNQARVHHWYEAHFGHPYPRLESSKDGIRRFLVASTCVGLNPREVYAPNGLQALYEGLLSLNPLTPYPSLYEQKALSYQQRWPWLRRVESPKRHLCG